MISREEKIQFLRDVAAGNVKIGTDPDAIDFYALLPMLDQANQVELTYLLKSEGDIIKMMSCDLLRGIKDGLSGDGPVFGGHCHPHAICSGGCKKYSILQYPMNLDKSFEWKMANKIS